MRSAQTNSTEQVDDQQLLQSLLNFELEVKAEGTLNGNSSAAIRGLAQADHRGLDIQQLEHLLEWSSDFVVDWVEVNRFLDLLGRGDDSELVLALFPPDPSKPMIHKPQRGEVDAKDVVETLVRRAEDQLSLGMVVNRAGERPLDWGKRPEHFNGNRPAKRERKCKVWNGQEKGIKAKNRPKTWGASNDHIGESVAVWFEGDGALPVEEQERFHELIGLPAPTFTVWTGSKSLHNYYVLDVPCSPEKSHFLMDWIGTALKRANPEAGADESLKNPCRVMRVPGGKHGKTGGRAYIYSEHPLRRRFTVAELEAALPEEDRPERRSRIRDLKWKNSKASRENWWTRLSPEEQWNEAVLMMSFIPPRLKPSADGGPVGTRKPALTVLGGLADEFGPEDAVAICIEAQWFNEWWDPAVEVENFDPVHLTIWTVVKHATKHGYLKPQDRRLKALKEEANKGHSSDPPLQGEWAETFDWMLTEEISCEVLIEKALKAEAEETGSEWLCHQERFRRYLPDQGYYESVSFTELKKHVSELLRRVYEVRSAGKQEIVVRRQTTDSKAEACTRWMATTATASQMDVVDAVAFRNGTLHPTADGWVLRPHTAQNRLTYGINGDWVENAECPPHCREFFRTSYGTEWLHIIRAVIAYTADPRYVCRVVLFLLGLSGTGKGTFERLLEAIFPADTVVTLQRTAELDSPERVGQYVCGKRLVSFPDLQGHQTGLGTLYSLTEGGLLTARHLYSRDSFSFPFNGRVVVCSSSVPSMDNAGSGMVRRVLPITTKNHRLKSDLLKGLRAETLDAALKAEIGQLVSWALQMPREEVEAVLQCQDPDGLLSRSRIEVETAMDATRAFIDQCLEPATATTVPDRTELFSAYQLFCRARGFKGVCNETTFTNRIKGVLPEMWRPRMSVPGSCSAAKVPAMFFGFRLVEGLWHPDRNTAAAFTQSHETERGPNGVNWGVLFKSRLKDGGLAELKASVLQIPTHEELKEAGIV